MDRLIKLKFLENLEFLQWVKKFWDSNFPGGHYDAAGRRGGKALQSEASAPALRSAAPQRLASMAAPSAPRQATALRSTEPIRPAVRPASGPQDSAKLQALLKEVTELRLTVDEVEKERDFYFGKLRDIEIEVQKMADTMQPVPEFVQAVSAILYKTEEGFETPEAMTN